MHFHNTRLSAQIVGRKHCHAAKGSVHRMSSKMCSCNSMLQKAQCIDCRVKCARAINSMLQKAQCIDCRVKCARAINSMVQGSVHRLSSSCACISMLQG